MARLIETVQKFVVGTEEEAKSFIERTASELKQKGATIKKSGYEYKTKKLKGEIVDYCYVISITSVFDEIWEAK